MAIQAQPSSDLMTKLLGDVDLSDPNITIDYGNSPISFSYSDLNDEEISRTVDEPEESTKSESDSLIAYNEGLKDDCESMISSSKGPNVFESPEDILAIEMAEVDIF